MKKFALFCISCAVLVCATVPAFAKPTVKITAPELTFTVTGNDFLKEQLEKTFDETANTYLSTELDKLEDSTQDELDGFGSQDKLAMGFGNANLYASQSATLQGYQGYKLFAVSSGVMVGLQLPTSDFASLGDSFDNFEDDPDVYLGIAPSMSFLNVGINAENVFGMFSKSLGEKLKNFYFNVKFGALDYTYEFEQDGTPVDIDMASGTFGLGVNYQIVPSTPSILFGLLKWRGVSLGSGLTYQHNAISMTPDIDPITQEFEQQLVDGTQTVTATIACYPDMKVGIDMTTFSIPLEATTSAQFLWIFNTNLGAGVDLVFGSSNITAEASGKIKIEDVVVEGGGYGSITSTGKDGSVKIDASTKGKPSFARARLMTGIGMNAGPLKIDIPVYFYPGSGYAFGATVAIVW